MKFGKETKAAKRINFERNELILTRFGKETKPRNEWIFDEIW